MRLLLLLTVSVSLLVACTPKDKDLHRPNYFKQGDGSKGLRIGAYGQPIWALQNIEQVGTLMQLCFKSEEPLEVGPGGKTTKSCQIQYVHDFDLSEQSKSQISETWKILLVLKDNENGYALTSANGELEAGTSTVPYRGMNTYLKYHKKTFSYAADDKDLFSIILETTGEIGSEKDQIEFTEKSHSEGSSTAQSWEINQFEYQLALLNRNQTFNLSSGSMRLNWISPLCAEPAGEVQAVEQGKRPARIILSPVIAKQILDNGREGWKSASFEDCQGRAQALPNFEFLFY